MVYTVLNPNQDTYDNWHPAGAGYRDSTDNPYRSAINDILCMHGVSGAYGSDWSGVVLPSSPSDFRTVVRYNSDNSETRIYTYDSTAWVYTAMGDIDDDDYARLSATQTFTGINTFTSIVLTGTITGATNLNISNWDTAFSWGDHASGGYAVLSATQTFTGINTFSDVMKISSATPQLRMIETDASVDNGTWDFYPNSEQFRFRIVNDAFTSAYNIFTVDRTGTTIDDITFYPLANFSAGIAVTGIVTISDGLVITGNSSNTFIRASDANQSYMYFQNTTTGSTTSDGFTIGLGVDEKALINNRENTDMEFNTNNTLRMSISASGGVNIIGAITSTYLDTHIGGTNGQIGTFGSQTSYGTSWRDNYSIIENNNFSIQSHNTTALTYLNNNVNYNDTDRRYKVSDDAQMIELGGDKIRFDLAPTGTAGTVPTFTTPMIMTRTAITSYKIHNFSLGIGVTGNITATGNITMDGTTLTLGGGALVDRSFTATSGGLKLNGDFFPASDSTYDLGGVSTQRWNVVYRISESSSSYRDMKDNFDYEINALGLISQLKPLAFDWKKEMKNKKSKEFGIILEEIPRELDFIVHEVRDKETNELVRTGIQYDNLTALNTKAIQEVNEKLNEKVYNLEEELLNIKEQIKELLK